jgi:hypothetical protein
MSWARFKAFSEHFARPLALLVLVISGSIAAVSALALMYMASYIPDILQPGSGGGAQMLLAIFFIPLAIGAAIALVKASLVAMASWLVLIGTKRIKSSEP